MDPAGGYFVYRIFNPLDGGDNSGDPSKLRKTLYTVAMVPAAKFPLQDVPPGSNIKISDNFGPPKIDPSQINHF